MAAWRTKEETDPVFVTVVTREIGGNNEEMLKGALKNGKQRTKDALANGWANAKTSLK
jgi:hypothetical protein